MAFEQKDNSGSLFANKDKKTDNHPDRNGSAKIDGVDYWVSGWVKQDKNGQPWLSMAFKRKDQPARSQEQIKTAKPLSRAHDDLSDEVPF